MRRDTRTSFCSHHPFLTDTNLLLSVIEIGLFLSPLLLLLPFRSAQALQAKYTHNDVEQPGASFLARTLACASVSHLASLGMLIPPITPTISPATSAGK